jgi:unsaturated rhamnogalacturonyl hydrolase
LWRHAWLVHARRAVGGFWLRGNGWVVASLVELLDVEERAELVRLLERVVSALVSKQRADGSWSTLVGSNAYAETSGTALVAFAIAKGVRRGWLARDLRVHAERAMSWLDSQVQGDSLVGISGPTNALPAFTYRLVPRRRNISYGVGAYSMAASELR